MIPQIGFTEMIVLALLAIIVVGPKDLPKLMRTVGGWMARAKAMANEFTSAFDEMGAEEEINELRQEIQALKEANPLKDIKENLLGDEMRALDNELRETANMSNPKQLD